MCILTMSDDERRLVEQLMKDNQHFKRLLDLIPPQFYFSQEEKDEIWGNTAGSEDDDEELFGRKNNGKQPRRRVHAGQKLASLTVSQIAAMRSTGETVGNKRKHQTTVSEEVEDVSADNGIAAKHQGKKQSRSSKGKKPKAKEIQRRDERLEELKEKLRRKREEMKVAGKVVSSQLQKQLKRQEKKVNAKLKTTNKKQKDERQSAQIADGLKSPPQNKIVNANGKLVKSKFDFSTISFGSEKAKSDLRGRDYKRLLEKVERRKEKVEKLKETDMEAGRKLESKLQWQNVLSKAQGEKVKDDMTLLKKAAKRKDKVKEKKKKTWGERVSVVKDKQKKRSDKREANINKRKTDKMDKKKKILIKKGRVVPGF